MNYVLTSAAEADLREIMRYTRKRWGSRQARCYLGKLEKGIVSVVTGGDHYKPLDSIFPGLRVGHRQHHYVFSLQRKDAPALIVAVLHERMDVISRAASRLDT